MKRVISFSLWGDNKTYTHGAIQNAILAKSVYPDFECWYYVHEPSVPKDIVHTLSGMDNVKVLYKHGDITNTKPMTWRFEAIDDPSVELMLSRDTDTRFLLREKLAVYEWIESGKLFHIMRDHPHHRFPILGGMFGTRKIDSIPSWADKIRQCVEQHGPRDYDQTFLKDIIYPFIVANSLVHTSFFRYGGELCVPFPIAYDGEYHFVGEYVYHDNTRSVEHTEILRNSL